MVEPRVINVQDQAKLSFQKVYSLVRSGIKHRLLRSTLTMSVILLAVAFFMVTLSENVIINSVAKGVEQEILTERSSIYVLNHLYIKPNLTSISVKLSKAHDNERQLKEYAAVTGWDLEKVKELSAECMWEQSYYQFFNNMSVGNRKMLIGNNKGPAIFTFLQDDKNFGDFQKNLEPLRSLKLPTDEGKLQALLNNQETFRASLSSFLSAWNNKIEELDGKTQELTKKQELNTWLCDVDDAQMAAWEKLLADMNFMVEEKAIKNLQSDMLKLRARNEVTNALLSPELKKEWQETFLVKEPLAEMIKRLRSEDVVEIVNKYTVHKYTHEDLTGIADNVDYNQSLSALESDLLKQSSKDSGSILSGRQTFLLIISFIVCMVGIANAMLMAITERFREIATMKCLGATDSFILIQFMMEAAIQGVAGGVLGMIIGFILALLKTTFSYGLYPFTYFPFVALVVCALVSLAIGIVLAVLASLYPSWAASRMAPMEAMRIE